MTDPEISVKQQLLGVAEDICRQQPVICHNEQATAVSWTNTTDYMPGIGLEIDLTRSISDPRAKIIRADYFVFERRGETIMVVRHTDPEDLYNDDPLAIWVRDIYSQYDPANGIGLSGLLKIQQLRGRLETHQITPVTFSTTIASIPTGDLMVS